MNIHQDLEAIKAVALDYASKDGYNYNIILLNPNSNGEFDEQAGSTYEFVMDSYFEKERPNAKILFKTKDLIQEKEADRLIDGLMENAKIRHELESAEMQPIVPSKNASKLKKGLSVIPVQADGIRYKHGSSGLERMENTNRNDLCNCGSGKKFKKCHGK